MWQGKTGIYTLDSFVGEAIKDPEWNIEDVRGVCARWLELFATNLGDGRWAVWNRSEAWKNTLEIL